ncbi:MAG: thioredoxin domain-containing protein, partial [Bacteroidota bacterium]
MAIFILNKALSDFIRKKMEQGKKPNRLISEKSPYLLQHAFNPVDWYPWGDEAFAKARGEQMPIFLSVGYSTCHWCHVMERESFENDSIAQIMNKYFVCIKVDREERPDVDKVYMTALQGMGQNGGWPMSMFLTPDLKPFYGGTYFPPQSMHGRMGFPDLLTRIHEVWETQREKILQSADGITEAMRDIPTSLPGSGVLDSSLLDTCYNQFVHVYDHQFGGFGNGPKFPRPAVYNFLLRYYVRSGNARALEMVGQTLRKMSMGGVYDHIGGGFHRYSVDGEWRVPHFEKMLYDQAQIVSSYIDLFQITKDPLFASVAREVLEYVMRDMTHPQGGFYSAEDADSPKPEAPEEEGEGAFFLWTRKEVISVLGQEDAEVLCFYYGVEEAGNAPSDPQHEFTRKNILYIARSLEQTARSFNRPEKEIAEVLSRSKQRLFAARSNRPRPHLDDKILTSWNGLMISAFSRAHQVLGDPNYLEAAERAAGFILANMHDGRNNQLIRRYRDGEARHEAHLDDYAFIVQGLLDLYEASFDVKWLTHALEITRTQIALFWDSQGGGFFDTAGKDPSVLVRMKEQYDGAEPTGNAIAVVNLVRLSQITNSHELREKANQT